MHWKQLIIDGKTFLSKCVIDDSVVKFFLSDFEYLWREESSTDEILNRAREQNKRIEYDNEIILSTLVSLPSQVSFHPLENKANLDYKYFVSNRPLNIKWQLEKCDQKMFMEIMLHPLLLSVSSLAKQNTELIDIIRKKDIEIEQYKLEGATLKRYKLITEKFDPAEYEGNVRYKPVPEFVAFADNQYEKFIKLNPKGEYITNSATNTPQKKAGISNNHKFSPKSKKNSGYRKHIQQINQKLDMPSQKVNFDDSDSNTPPAMSEIEVEEILHKQDRGLQKASSSSYTQETKRLKLSRKNINL